MNGEPLIVCCNLEAGRSGRHGRVEGEEKGHEVGDDKFLH